MVVGVGSVGVCTYSSSVWFVGVGCVAVGTYLSSVGLIGVGSVRVCTVCELFWGRECWICWSTYVVE